MADDTPPTATPPYKDIQQMTKDLMNGSKLVLGTRRQLFTGAFLGTGVVFFGAMLGLPHLDTPYTVALYAFAFAIPCLATAFGTATYRFIVRGDTDTDKILEAVADNFTNTMIVLGDCLGMPAAMIGIVAVFWHFSAVAGIVALATPIGMLLTHVVVFLIRLAGRIWRYLRTSHSSKTAAQ
jgi:hypothetical protein